MRNALILAALAGLAASQDINYGAVDAAPDPVFVTPPSDVTTDNPPDVSAAPITPITNSPSRVKRGMMMEKRDGDCSPQPAGSGPVASPDTDTAFLSDSGLQVNTC